MTIECTRSTTYKTFCDFKRDQVIINTLFCLNETEHQNFFKFLFKAAFNIMKLLFFVFTLFVPFWSGLTSK